MKSLVVVAMLLTTGLAGCCFSPTGETPQQIPDGSLPDGGPPPDAGPTPCMIDGITYVTGAINPANPCQGCRADLNSSDWSNLEAGTTCAGGGVCANGDCLQGCVSDGGYVAIGVVEPTGCRQCAPMASGGWNVVPDGTTCVLPDLSGTFCHAGSCEEGCVIDGTFFALGSANPANSCQRCSRTSTSQWVTQNPGTPCASQGICDRSGNCGPGSCSVGSVQVPNRASNPADPSLCCNVILDPNAWSPRLVPGQRLSGPLGGQMVAGDFNGDGWLDLAVTGYESYPPSPQLFVLLNEQGVLKLGEGTALGVNTYWIVATDLNRDGFTDLVTSNLSPHSLSVFMARGDGTFYPPVDYPCDDPSRGSPFGPCGSLIAGDLNGDGLPDIAGGAYGSTGEVRFFQGIGDGGFLPFEEMSYGSADAFAVADFNGDGLQDLAFDFFNSLSLLPGSERDAFLDGGSYSYAPSQVGYMLGPITAGDFDGDGFQDLGVGIQFNSGGAPSPSYSFGILSGLGNGSFRDWSTVSLPGFVAGFAPADLDADGKNELYIATATPSGDGYTNLPGLYVLNLAAGGAFQEVLRVDAGPGEGFGYPVVGDFNHDGAQDIAAVTGQSVSVYLNGCP